MGKAPSMSQYVAQQHTTSKTSVTIGAVRIMGVLVMADGEAAAFELLNALTDTSSDELIFDVVTGETRLFDFTPFGGVMFSTGLTLTLTTGKCVIWTDRGQVAG